MRKKIIQLLVISAALFFLVLALHYISPMMHKRPLVVPFSVAIYLLYLAHLERKDVTAKISIYATIIFSALLFYSYYFV